VEAQAFRQPKDSMMNNDRVPSLLGPLEADSLARIDHLEELLTQRELSNSHHYYMRVLYEAIPLALNMDYQNVLNVLAAGLSYEYIKENPCLILQDASVVSKDFNFGVDRVEGVVFFKGARWAKLKM